MSMQMQSPTAKGIFNHNRLLQQLTRSILQNHLADPTIAKIYYCLNTTSNHPLEVPTPFELPSDMATASINKDCAHIPLKMCSVYWLFHLT